MFIVGADLVTKGERNAKENLKSAAGLIRYDGLSWRLL
jgi:hypothetical protein